MWTIKLLLLLGTTATFAASINSERQDTSNSSVTKHNITQEVPEGVSVSVESTDQLAKPAHNDPASTPVVLSPNVTISKNDSQVIANSTASLNSTSTTSTTTTTTTTTSTVPPPKVLINYNFPPLNKTTTAALNFTTTTTTTEKIIPVNEIEVGEKNDNKMSVAKKGFRMNETEESLSSSSASTTTTVSQRPKKPTVTIGNDDTVDSIGNNATRITVNSNMNLPTASRKTDYIVPIVGVILSVPLVAILLNLVYRKTKDWWQYRHYKRMDLIDGIYNN